MQEVVISRRNRTTKENEIGPGNGTENGNENENENGCTNVRKRESGSLKGDGTVNSNVRGNRSESTRENEREKGDDRLPMTSTVSIHPAKVNCPTDIGLWVPALTQFPQH